MLHPDVFVVGAGPAGLAAAIAARRLGLDVVIADGRRPPIDKACGEGLMPAGVAALRELGIVPATREAIPFVGIRFLAGESAAEARMPGGPGLGMRRTVLHRLLVERAEQLGVVMRWGEKVDGEQTDRLRVGGQAVTSKWVVGADGHNSLIRRTAGLAVASARYRVGVRQHFRLSPWTNLVEVHWHARGQAYVTPVGPREVGVAIIGNHGPLHLDEIPRLFPRLWVRLRGAEASTSPKGGLSSSLRLNRVTGDRIALVGDAAGSVDAITGDGLSLAFGQALALAKALADEELDAYAAAHRRLMQTARMAAAVLLTLATREHLRGRAIAALGACPVAFQRLLAVHVGEISPGAIGVGALAGLLWRFLWPGNQAMPAAGEPT